MGVLEQQVRVCWPKGLNLIGPAYAEALGFVVTTETLGPHRPMPTRVGYARAGCPISRVMLDFQGLCFYDGLLYFHDHLWNYDIRYDFLYVTLRFVFYKL